MENIILNIQDATESISMGEISLKQDHFLIVTDLLSDINQTFEGEKNGKNM